MNTPGIPFPRRARRLVAVLAVSASCALLVACGSSGSNSSSSNSSNDSSNAAATSAPAGSKIKVGLVTDIGGLNDRGFNALANMGVQSAERQLGIQGRVITTQSNADYVPDLSTLAQQHYDLVIGVGFLMTDAVDEVATKFPDTKFAIIDVPSSALKHKPTNVEGLVFKEQQAGYLAGYVAGLYAKGHKISAVSSIGGQKIPPVDRYIAGYQAGAQAADPGISTLNGYSQDFADQAKCKELALNQIGSGAKIVFAVASQCGLGALDAVKQAGLQGIGVDADQGYLGSHILTSATKKVDVAVLTAIKQAQTGTFKGGQDTSFDVTNGGVGLGKLSATGASYQAAVDKVMAQIKAGSIQIPTTVK